MAYAAAVSSGAQCASTVTKQDNDMKTSQFLIAGAIAALLQAGVAAAQSPPPDPAGKSAQSSVTFESLDKDGDGRVSKTEAEADARISKNFAMYDKNGNGYIEKDEVMSPDTSPPATPQQ